MCLQLLATTTSWMRQHNVAPTCCPFSTGIDTHVNMSEKLQNSWSQAESVFGTAGAQWVKHPSFSPLHYTMQQPTAGVESFSDVTNPLTICGSCSEIACCPRHPLWNPEQRCWSRFWSHRQSCTWQRTRKRVWVVLPLYFQKFQSVSSLLQSRCAHSIEISRLAGNIVF